MPKTIPCLWFDTQGEDAVKLYTSVFPNSRILGTTHYGDEGPQAGQVMTINFELDGQEYLALNGGPQYRFSEAVSFQILCQTQEEIDHYWDHLTDGGEEGPCGWLKDRFGLSWQVVPSELLELIASSDAAVAKRVTDAFMAMHKFDLAALRAAAAG